MRGLFRLSAWHVCRVVAVAVLGVPWSVDVVHAQGVTTGVVMGVVKDARDSRSPAWRDRDPRPGNHV